MESLKSIHPPTYLVQSSKALQLVQLIETPAASTFLHDIWTHEHPGLVLSNYLNESTCPLTFTYCSDCQKVLLLPDETFAPLLPSSGDCRHVGFLIKKSFTSPSPIFMWSRYHAELLLSVGGDEFGVLKTGSVQKQQQQLNNLRL
ncbi:hypothetical protein ATANTOWER_017029 [Ataeniobius toweri]|uniref:Uncharacterized protein n=1 Tax=Ataeniobius toweri TaxID=208326 RepID=A0ABU7BJ41_9TELE|nr:hypothetical protein [Ataeniobius toweri]